MNKPPISYKRHRFPPQIIAHAVWLYFRFPLSLRMVEEILLERGIVCRSAWGLCADRHDKPLKSQRRVGHTVTPVHKLNGNE